MTTQHQMNRKEFMSLVETANEPSSNGFDKCFTIAGSTGNYVFQWENKEEGHMISIGQRSLESCPETSGTKWCVEVGYSIMKLETWRSGKISERVISEGYSKSVKSCINAMWRNYSKYLETQQS